MNKFLPHHLVEIARRLYVEHSLAVGRVGDDADALILIGIITDIPVPEYDLVGNAGKLGVLAGKL